MTEDRLAPPTFDPADAAAAAARFAASAPADVHYAMVDSPIGTLVAASTPRGLATLSYADRFGGTDGALDWVAARLSPRMLEAPARLDDVRRELDEYFAGTLQDFTVPLSPRGSTFQKQVWQALSEIPYGETTSYGKVAASIGHPDGARAVGVANGQNPIPIIVPCHRVIGADGSLTGYGGGLDAKRWLLDHEARHAGLTLSL
jgi:methylated-DNA-[protein]-cysteine S-methyltransferase